MRLPRHQYVTLSMTRQRALELDLLVCTCGHRENNHFDHGNSLCAHCRECKGYKEDAVPSVILKP